jgi:hypothetical protein
MTKIYDQHAAAFSNVSAFVIMKDGERVATIAFKFPKDGAGRLWCYCHWLGLEMVRGYASGYGYDKRSAAVEAAARNYTPQPKSREEAVAFIESNKGKFLNAIFTMGGKDWNDALRDAGFTVLHAV